jgi:hypothetical protein
MDTSFLLAAATLDLHSFTLHPADYTFSPEERLPKIKLIPVMKTI